MKLSRLLIEFVARDSFLTIRKFDHTQKKVIIHARVPAWCNLWRTSNIFFVNKENLNTYIWDRNLLRYISRLTTA